MLFPCCQIPSELGEECVPGDFDCNDKSVSKSNHSLLISSRKLLMLVQCEGVCDLQAELGGQDRRWCVETVDHAGY